MNKTLKIIGITILILILFRGVIYRSSIKYVEIGNRPEVKITHKKLIEKIESKSSVKEIGLEEIVQIANKITVEELEFTTDQVSADPNILIDTKQANCVGYAAMFNSIANYLIRKHKLQDEMEAEHKIGELEFLGINLNQFFENPFYKDHDFNELRDKKTGEVIFVDPSLSDYFWIKSVAKSK